MSRSAAIIPTEKGITHQAGAGADERQVRGQAEEDPVAGRRLEVFLQDQLHAVGEELDAPVDPDPVGTDPGLDVASQLPQHQGPHPFEAQDEDHGGSGNDDHDDQRDHPHRHEVDDRDRLDDGPADPVVVRIPPYWPMGPCLTCRFPVG